MSQTTMQNAPTTDAGVAWEEPRPAAIAPAPNAGEALWFLGCLVTVKASAESTGGGVAVLEHLAPRGAGSPLHVHRREDEWFYVLEGELTFWVGGEVIEAAAGTFVYGPRGVPHTFIVSSERARFLLVAEPAGFEALVRATAVPAEQRRFRRLRRSRPTWRRSPLPRPPPASRSSDLQAFPPDNQCPSSMKERP